MVHTGKISSSTGDLGEKILLAGVRTLYLLFLFSSFSLGGFRAA